MNVVDRIHLDLFLAELSQSTIAAKNERAEALIKQAFERQPDAAYLLVQRVLRLESELCAACATADSSADEARGADGRSPDEGGSRASEPWWREPVDALAGTRMLLQSTPYLVGGRDARRSADAA